MEPDFDENHLSQEAAAQLLNREAAAVEDGNHRRRPSGTSRIRKHGKRIVGVIAFFFVALGVYVAGSAVYSTMTGNDHHEPKSRGKRAGHAPAYITTPITDPHERRMILEDINEKRALNTRYLVYRRDWTEPTAELLANLPPWFNQILFRKGEELGVGGLTRLMPTENCDMIVVKRHVHASTVLDKDQLPSTRFQAVFSPMYPLYFGVGYDKYNVPYEGQSYVGPSLDMLMRLGIIRRGMSLEVFHWFLRVVHRTLRNMYGLGEEKHQCFGDRSILIGLTNPLTLDGKSLIVNDTVVLGRLHCVTVKRENLRGDVGAIRTPEYHLSELLLNAVGGQANNISKEIELPAGAVPAESYKPEYRAVIAHLRWGDLPNVAPFRYFELFDHIKPTMDAYKKDVCISPTFAARFVGSLSPIIVSNVFVEGNELKTELRKFYPAFYPFAVLECHLHGEAAGKLCTVGAFRDKLRERYGDAIKDFKDREIGCPLRPDAGPELPRIAGEEREPYVYPDGWNYEKCMAMLNKVVNTADVTSAHGIVPIEVKWCKLGDRRQGLLKVVFRDYSPRFVHNYEVLCCTYDLSAVHKDYKCERTVVKPTRPWEDDLQNIFFAVDDVLIRGESLNDPDVQNDAPLLSVNDPADAFEPKMFPAEQRRHLYQQRFCIRSSKNEGPHERRSTPKKSVIHQQYFENDKHWWIFHNIRFDGATDDAGSRMDRCETVFNVEDHLRFCQERGYVCRFVDGDMTAEEWMNAMWTIAKEFLLLKGRSFTYNIATHGTNDDEKGRSYVIFPEKDPRRVKMVDVDKFFEDYLKSPPFFAKVAYVMIGACRGGDFDVLTTRSLRQSTVSIVSTCSRRSSQVSRASGGIEMPEARDEPAPLKQHCLVYIPEELEIAPKGAQETFLAYLRDTDETRRLIVKAPSDGCAGMRGQLGSYFFLHYYELARLYPELPVIEIWHRVQGRITDVFRTGKIDESDRETAREIVKRQTTTITLDHLGIPTFMHPVPSRTVTDDQLYPADYKPFRWSSKYCFELSKQKFGDKERPVSVAQRLLDKEWEQEKVRKNDPTIEKPYT